MGSIGIDPSQARVYYHPGEETRGPRALIVSPDNTPFRRSAKGMVKGRSKSFDDSGAPVSEVLFLYALKTGRYDDRLRALDSLSPSFWTDLFEEKNPGLLFPKGPTLGQKFDKMHQAATSASVFEELHQRRLSESLKDTSALTNFPLWEKVANTAEMFTRERINKASVEPPTDYDASFLRAVRETTLEHGGLPAQTHVNRRWIDVANRRNSSPRARKIFPGEWRDIRNKLGFAWLPPETDWKRDWLPLSQKGKKR